MPGRSVVQRGVGTLRMHRPDGKPSNVSCADLGRGISCAPLRACQSACAWWYACSGSKSGWSAPLAQWLGSGRSRLLAGTPAIGSNV